MTLTSARGPLGPDPRGRFVPPIAPGTAYVEPHRRRIEAVLHGDVVLRSEAALLLHRPGRPPAYAFPADEVAATGLPSTPTAEAPGHVEVPWDAVDTWIEEGRQLVHYPPNPYHRVDCRPTRRRLRVEVDGLVLVDTDDTTIVFETALEPTLYVRPELVRTDLLVPSATTTYCNYKGWSTYWSLRSGDLAVDDVAWSHEDPEPESRPIEGMLAFAPDRTALTADL